MSYLVFLIAGLMFGAGLTISGMVNPEKILGFLDFAAIPSGNWDPSLAVVFAAGLAPMFVAYTVQRRMNRPVAAPKFQIPEASMIDWRLISGAVVFGAGWGLAGLCPGPAITGLAFGNVESFLFAAAMFAGFFIHKMLPTNKTPEQDEPAKA